MKIEVTFEKSTKQTFRDECVKRLQSFVNQIKSKEQKIPSQRSHTFRPSQDELKLVQSIVQVREGSRREVPLRTTTDRKGRLKDNSVRNLQGTNLESVLASQNGCSQKQKQNRTNKEVFDLGAIRTNLDKIMFKLETNSKIQQLETQRLQREVQTTNSKLDQLIIDLEQRNIIGKDKNQSFSTQEVFGFDNSTHFIEKFTELTQRYNKIKTQGVRPLRQPRNSKPICAYDLEQTGDSLTFRRC